MKKLKGAAIIAACALVVGCGKNENDTSANAALIAATQAAVAASTAIADAGRPFPKWSYDSFTDPMVGKQVSSADLSSNETISLSPPYEGNQSATLVLRTHPDGDVDILFTIRRGQLVCNENVESGGCPINVRLGSDPQQIAYGNSPTDHSQNAIFLHGQRLTLPAIAAAGVMRVEVPIFDNGSHIFTFDVAGLDLSKLKAPGS